MNVRTYFWEDRIVSPLEFRLRDVLGLSPYNHFLVGNAGDVLARELITRLYGCRATNDASRGRRLLLVGSIGHRIRTGDLLCGIGVKTRALPRASDARVDVWAVRGPISREAFRSAGHDVSGVRFELDPGLMIRFMVPSDELTAEPRGIAFIPHYRERAKYVKRPLPYGMRMVDIDSHPLDLARAILRSELVYSSSLHGVIFAHALERPCVLVSPQTEEPRLKYEDYFASIHVPMPKPLGSIFDARPHDAPTSPADVRIRESDFAFPTLEDLVSRGIAVD